MKILQASAEFFGLAKTGGLADMVASLTATLSRAAQHSSDVRVCLPAYSGTLEKLTNIERCGVLQVHGHEFQIVQGQLPAQSDQLVILLDCPELFDRPGDPYRDANGAEFNDNGWRFGCFNKAVALLALQGLADWQPNIVHLHDWHLGLAPALLTHPELLEQTNRSMQQRASTIKTVFTIHNFSFHGVFGRELFDSLNLPANWWHPQQIEFYGHFSFMKAALLHADQVTAVSPRYAHEIATEEFGCGLQGLVIEQADRIQGIVNGIDEEDWNPATDNLLPCNYSLRNVSSGKKANKADLQKALGLPVRDIPLVIFIGRFADQKGADLILQAREQIDQLPMQLVVLGRGESHLEEAFDQWAKAKPERVAALIDISEEMAHRLTAAADLQLMPSRFEPCGLSQMYAQRYGTLPVARATGGLADTIEPVTAQSLEDATATGFLFDKIDAGALVVALQQALTVLQDKRTTRKLRQTAMKRDFSWSSSADAYRALYRSLIASNETATEHRTGANRPINGHGSSAKSDTESQTRVDLSSHLALTD